MLTFPQLPYTRQTYEDAAPKIQEMVERFKNAKTAEEAKTVCLNMDALSSNFIADYIVCYIRNHLDTSDKFYEDEQAHYDEIMPRVMEEFHAWTNALLETPFRKELSAEYGEIGFINAEIAKRSFSPDIVADSQEENALMTRYTKLLASAKIEFRGEEYNLAQMGPFALDADRATRKEATEATAYWSIAHQAQFDEIYDKLVALRTKMGKTLGHDNFIPAGYDKQGRNCYGPDEVAAYRAAVLEHIVPLVVKLKEKQAARIQVEEIKPYDDNLLFLDGNAAPKGTPDEILEAGRKMYHELSPETAEYIDAALKLESFDVLAKPNKAPGGFCYTIDKYKIPFVYANFNGTSDDVETLTHEVGHAFAAWRAFNYPISAQREYTFETAEVHSMAMEFLTWPWMELFYGNETDKFKQAHLENALSFLPYGCMVDEFQHIIYENPNMTPDERNKTWMELENKYRPWRKNEGVPFHADGRRWQLQSHIYQRPFYYIDYCLAQTNALAIWALSQNDWKDAWQKYFAFLEQAGTMTFVDLTAGAGLPSPFTPDALKLVAQAVENWL